MEMNEIKASDDIAVFTDVCILGGGISGLATAFYLMLHRIPTQPAINITIYEKSSRLGGNCNTFQLDLGVPGINRWADMGVNDFNMATYKKLRAMMEYIGYTDYADLENTELFFSNTGDNYLYSIDGEGFTKMPDSIAKGNTNFQKNAFADSQTAEFHDCTLQVYLDTINGRKPDTYPDEFIYKNLYPRVNAMYFAGTYKDNMYSAEVHPGGMSFRGIMSYYGLQEGYGTNVPPERKYFTKGTSHWIGKVKDALVKLASERKYNLNIQTNVDGSVDFDTTVGKPTVTVAGNKKYYDHVILSMPANDAATCYKVSGYHPDKIREALLKFPYRDDRAVVHTDTSVFPNRINTWRTYNVEIYARNDQSEPYRITYVGNRHQNDAKNPMYKCGTPQFFIALNPYISKGDPTIVKQTNGASTDTSFMHQKLSIDTMAQQVVIEGYQGYYYCWFINGFTYGAGLHEECLIQAWSKVMKLYNNPITEQVHYDFSPEAKQFAPDYLVHAHKRS